MKKLNYKTDLLFFKYYIYYLFNKKIVKKYYILKKRMFIILNILNIFFFVNIYKLDFYIDFFFVRYNGLKNFWFLFLELYKLINKSIKIKMKHLFKHFLLKSMVIDVIRYLFVNKSLNKKNLFFKFLPLQEILKEKKNNYKFFFWLIRMKKKFIKLKVYVNKNFKYKVKKKTNLKMPLFFFNKYKRYLHIVLMNHFNNILKINIKLRREFISYWARYYTYFLKRIYVIVESILKNFIYIVYMQYKNFISLINMKKVKKNKIFFYFYFLFNKYRYKFINKFKIYLYYFNIIRLLKLSFYKKKEFNIVFFFFKENKRKKYVYYRFKQYLEKINYSFKIKFLIFFKNFIFIFFLQFLIFWFNYYLVISKNIVNCFNYLLSNNNFKFELLYKELIFIRENKNWDNILFFKFIYFFYVNIVK